MKRLLVLSLVVVVATITAQAQSIAERAGLYVCRILNDKQERVADHEALINLLSDGTFNVVAYDSGDSLLSDYNAGEFRLDHSVSVPESDKHALGYFKGLMKVLADPDTSKMAVDLQMSSNNDFIDVHRLPQIAVFYAGTEKTQGLKRLQLFLGPTEFRCGEIHVASHPGAQRQSANLTGSDKYGPLKTASIPKQAGTYLSLMPDDSDLPPMIIVLQPNGEIRGTTFQDKAQLKEAIQCKLRCLSAKGVDLIVGSLRYSDPNAMTHTNRLIVDLSAPHLDYKGSAYFDLEGNELKTTPDPRASASQTYPTLSWARIG